VPNFEASDEMLSLAPVILWVVQVDSAWPQEARFRWNFSAFSLGSRILVLSPPMITGRLNWGLSALNSSSDISASWAAIARSMSLVLSMAVKYGWLSITGRVTLYCPGLLTMFLTACSFGS